MKRSGFKPKLPPRPVKVYEVHTPRTRAVACSRSDGVARLVVPVPKRQYVRDTRYRDACRAMACQHCGAAGERAGVTWAHSNSGAHGKGMGIKADDAAVAALCAECHRWLDQGAGTAEQKQAMWEAAHRRTVAQGLRDGTWPTKEKEPA